VNVEDAARAMWAELYNVRKQKRDLREQLDQFEKRTPAGSLILLGNDVTAWNALKALGTPDEIKTKLGELAQLKTQEAQRARLEVRKEAAKSLGFHPLALDDRLTVSGLDVELRDEQQADGQTKKVAYVRKNGDASATWEPLKQVAERDWKAHLSALRAASANGDGEGSHESAGTDVIYFPDNGAHGGAGGARSVVDRFIEDRDKAAAKRPNPLGAAAGR
jgi:hypothetical protein